MVLVFGNVINHVILIKVNIIKINVMVKVFMNGGMGIILKDNLLMMLGMVMVGWFGLQGRFMMGSGGMGCRMG